MTVEEAIKALQVCFSLSAVDDEAVVMAINALKKQIPKKPIDEYNRIAYCPACGKLIVDTYCCPECGQKIDWRKE